MLQISPFKADLHIHTLLSPCGDLEMSPRNICQRAVEEKLQIIGICDHNSTRQAPLLKELCKEKGIEVFIGSELTSKEEVHCLAFFENEQQRKTFQECLDSNLPHVPNDNEKFGYQVVVDKDENIVYEEPFLLHSALPYSIDELYDQVHKLGGLFIPAHVDKMRFGLIGQLGFVPPDIRADAIELSPFMSTELFKKRFAYLKKFAFIHSSDAHIPDVIGKNYCKLYMCEPTFEEFRKCLRGEEGRFVE